MTLLAKNIACTVILTLSCFYASKVIKQLQSYEIRKESSKYGDSNSKKLEYLQQAVKYQPLNPHLFDKMGQIHLRLAKKSNKHRTYHYLKSIYSFTKAINLNPAYHNHHLRLAAANFWATKDLDRFIEAFNKIEKIDPFNDVVIEHKAKLQKSMKNKPE